MINETTEYVCIKLSTGDDVMGLKIGSDDEYTTLLYPMKIDMIQSQRGDYKIVSRFSARPLCQFSEVPEYQIKTKYIVYEMPLSKEMVLHFRSLVVQEKSAEQAIVKEDEFVEEEEFTKLDDDDSGNTYH